MSGPPSLPGGPAPVGDPDEPDAPALLLAFASAADAPLGAAPAAVRAWFDASMDSAIPEADGTLATAQRTAEILARHAKSDNTRRAYRAGVRAWCAWCGRHGLTPLPARPADIAAFLAAERYRPDGEKRLAANTLRLRVAAIGYLHYLAGCPSPTTTAAVTETFAGLDRLAKKAGQGPKPKLAAKIGILREIVAPIGDDLPGLRDRALLLLGFAGAFRRAELARIEVGDLEVLVEHILVREVRLLGGERHVPDRLLVLAPAQVAVERAHGVVERLVRRRCGLTRRGGSERGERGENNSRDHSCPNSLGEKPWLDRCAGVRPGHEIAGFMLGTDAERKHREQDGEPDG